MSSNATSWREVYTKQLLSRGGTLIVVESVFVVAITISALFGNILVCCVILKTSGLRQKSTNLYILALAISDILQACLGMPFTCGVLLTGKWLFGRVVCNLQGFLMLFTGFVSLHSVALTALNRYFCVVKPNLYRRWFGKRSSLGMLIAIWILAFVSVIVPQAMGSASFKFLPNRAACFMTLSNYTINIVYTVYSLLVFILIPFGIMAICYFKVYRVTREHKRNIGRRFLQAPTTTHQNRPQVSVEEIRVTNTLFAIVIAFISCWMPAILIEMIDTALPLGTLPREAYFTYMCLWFLASALNPFLYGIMSRTFREATVHALRPCCILDSNTVNIEPFTSARSQRAGQIIHVQTAAEN